MNISSIYYKYLSIKKRNRATVKKLRGLGFFMPGIRYALLKLNDIRVAELSTETGYSNVTIYAALNGALTSSRVRETLAERLLIPVAELFPDE